MSTVTLPPAVDADRHEINGDAGRMSYYVSGDGPPMLLVHSINAAGSVFEVRPVFEACRERYRVYAPDLPGFGHSDRSRRPYTVGLYVDAINDMLDLIERDCGSVAVDALALSLASEFLARAARDRPMRFRSLTLVSATGFRRGSAALTEAEGSTREMRRLAAVLEFPLWRSGLYRLLTRPGTIRYFLRRTFGSADIDTELAAYDDLTTHQPGAENAPFAFLSGRLFSKDIRNVYEALDMRVWLAHGTRGDFSDFSEAAWTQQRGNWRVTPFETGALPYFEQPALFLDRFAEFLEAAPSLSQAE
ncbi:MAG: alpha/beta hydrolase [Woeseiaceae bacterium]|nr:alpha/beta hydrolase [Woeseiaceae bacterium]